MIITNAIWEERNLGLTVQEVEIEQNDTTDTVQQGLAGLAAQYQVVKLPAALIRNSAALQAANFILAEAVITLQCQPEWYTGAKPSYRALAQTELSVIYNAIDANMFTSDRIVLDAHFTDKQTATRYKNWLQDEFDRGHNILGVVHQNEIVGFTALKPGKQGGNAYFAYLSGILPHYQGRGLSELFVGAGLEYIKQKGVPELVTKVSNNNMKSLSSHIKAGYRPISCDYVFVKHLQ